VSEILEVDIPIYVYRNVCQRINQRRANPHSRAGLGWGGAVRRGGRGQAGRGGQGQAGLSVGCGGFFDFKSGDLSFQFVEKLGFALKTNRNRKFDPLLNVFDTFCIHADA
jgi:hypothetical protein